MNSSAGWRLKVRDKIYKALAELPPSDRKRLLAAIEGLSSNPYIGDVDKMKGEENTWRRRIGSYRIFYEIILQDKIIYVFRVERRTSKTY